MLLSYSILTETQRRPEDLTDSRLTRHTTTVSIYVCERERCFESLFVVFDCMLVLFTMSKCICLSQYLLVNVCFMPKFSCFLVCVSTCKLVVSHYVCFGSFEFSINEPFAIMSFQISTQEPLLSSSPSSPPVCYGGLLSPSLLRWAPPLRRQYLGGVRSNRTVDLE